MYDRPTETRIEGEMSGAEASAKEALIKGLDPLQCDLPGVCNSWMIYSRRAITFCQN
jgi:hypothetical protein